MGKLGLTKIALLAFSMNFKCVDNALQRVDNGSKRSYNVTQSIVETLIMFNKCLRMDEKCFSMFYPNAAQNVEPSAVLAIYKALLDRLAVLNQQMIV